MRFIENLLVLYCGLYHVHVTVVSMMHLYGHIYGLLYGLSIYVTHLYGYIYGLLYSQFIYVIHYMVIFMVTFMIASLTMIYI